mgnify:CR=1 FL=1
MHRIAPCAPYLPRRASDTNKYDYGRVLIVGGCIGYTGAPTLCARAALRCGAGLVSVGVPEAIYAVTAVKNDEAMPFPLPSAEGKLARDALPVLLERLEKSDVCVLGPGLGRNDTLTALVQAVVMQSGTPLVLDADALFAVAQDAAVLRVGNPGMAKGGSGDVLAGMLGALLCQMPARDAVQTAVWLHGRAGDLCAGRMGEYAMNPTDVIAALPEVTKPIIR